MFNSINLGNQIPSSPSGHPLRESNLTRIILSVSLILNFLFLSVIIFFIFLQKGNNLSNDKQNLNGSTVTPAYPVESFPKLNKEKTESEGIESENECLKWTDFVNNFIYNGDFNLASEKSLEYSTCGYKSYESPDITRKSIEAPPGDFLTEGAIFNISANTVGSHNMDEFIAYTKEIKFGDPLQSSAYNNIKLISVGSKKIAEYYVADKETDIYLSGVIYVVDSVELSVSAIYAKEIDYLKYKDHFIESFREYLISYVNALN